MSYYAFKNNLKTTLHYDMSSIDTVIWVKQLVSSTDPATRLAAWPTCDATHTFTLTLTDSVTDAIEIVECIEVTANEEGYIAFSCERAQEGTSEAAHTITNTSVEHRLTAGALNAITGSLDEITSNVSESLVQHVGSIISVLATDTYVPLGCVPCDGAEYTRTQFTTLYDIYLTATTPKLLTCTYTEWSTQVGLTGNCAKFAVDTVNQKFKVPMLKNGDSITQAASASELGKSIKAGLPNAHCSLPWYAGYEGAADNPNTSGIAKHSSGNNPDMYIMSGGPVSARRIELDLSRASSVYQDGLTTVLVDQVRLRHFVVIASAQNNQSVFDWSNYMAGLAGKANLDMDNLTQIGSTKIANTAMPSGRSIVYAAPSVNGQSYTAPGDGYFSVIYSGATGGSTIAIANASTRITNGGTFQLGDIYVFVPCAKGQTIRINYYFTGGAWTDVRFTFAGGAY